ncbi:MAG TPA: trypsin-like serine protease [Myxococcota bacterium]|nr:trypsin-like serine protease [Myxococcota bacterium]
MRAAKLAQSREVMLRIVGGTEVAEGGYRDCALVGQQNANGTLSWFCSGALIHPRIVLTAGHCMDPGHGDIPNLVALSCVDMNRLTDAELVKAKTCVRHPSYGQGLGHDISVIVLRDEAKTPPVARASTSELTASPKTTLVGFGNSDVLSTRGFGRKREVSVDIGFLRGRTPDGQLDGPEHQLGFASELEYTAGGEGYDSCNGDSGGPSYVGAGSTYKLAGLTSRGFDDAHDPCGDGGIYTRVDVHASFIQQVAAQYGVSI